MAKKVWYISAALAAILILSGCAGIRPADRKAALTAELRKWENFSSEGVVRANYAGLTLRKMFVLNKTKDEARLDVLDGGVFGIGPQPLVTIYLGDYIALNSPFMPELETMALSVMPDSFSLDVLSDTDSLVERFGDEILSTGKLVWEGMELSFSDQLRLTRVADQQSGAHVTVSYTDKGDPDQVSIDVGQGITVDLLVDKTSYGDAEVVPLPETVPDLEQTMQSLEEDLLEGDSQP